MKRRVLVVGVELIDHKSSASEIAADFGNSRDWEVNQVWEKLGKPLVPKFILINNILAQVEDLADYSYVIVCDDDITFRYGFIDNYLCVVEGLDLALAQPARTHGSTIHHNIVEQIDGLVARETRFVEIGPLFSMRQDIVPHLTPFATDISPMGWGYEFHWPLVIEDLGLKMGIVDATPVEHSMRKSVSLYTGAGDQMGAYLQATPHIDWREAYVTLAEHR